MNMAKGIVRIALVENEQRIRQAARNIQEILLTTTGDIDAQRNSAVQSDAQIAAALYRDHERMC